MPSIPTVTELRKAGIDHGLDSIGFAKAEVFTSTKRHLVERKRQGLHGGMQFTYRNPERSTDPTRALEGAETLVVGARSYWRKRPKAGNSNEPLGKVALYALEDHYQLLRNGLEAIVHLLGQYGFNSKILIDDNALVDREAAYRAGIGWYGKNTNLLLPNRGSWFVLGTIVTDAKFPPDTPEERGCGTCSRCIPACPTEAITAPGVLDANRCLAWLLQSEGQFPIEFREALGDRIYGCDDCQLSCPINRIEERSHEEPVPNSLGGPVLIHEMLEMSDEKLIERFGRWYIPKRDPRYLRRNALVVLGNISKASSQKTRKILRRYLSDSDNMIRSHAVWAAKRLNLDSLLGEMKDDPSSLVQEELQREVSWDKRKSSSKK